MVSDGTYQDTGTVRIGVGDTAPVGQDDPVSTNEDTPVVINVLANDSDANGDAIKVVSTTQPSNGSVVINPNGTLTYTPNANFHGADSFTYTVGDGVLNDTAAVNLTVNSVPDAPVAGDDSLATLPNTALLINVAADLLVNDTDADNDPLSIVSFTQPSHGTLANNGDGTFLYTPNAGFSGTDTFTYTVGDGTGQTDIANVDIAIGDAIDVWYGTDQTFGALGDTQKWINILGNVDTTEVTSLTYSLNGGSEHTLSLGPDTRRLQNAGDFNIDIGYSALNGSATDDIVTIKANLADGGVQTKDVVVHYESGNVWSPNYNIDWSTVTNIQDVAQVVDGQWTTDGNGVRTAEPGYDRILDIGDYTWDNYRVDLTFTINSMNQGTNFSRDGAGFGFGLLWDGHTDDPISGAQPKEGYNPIVSPFYNMKDGQFILHDYPDWASPNLGSASYSFQTGQLYHVALQIEQTDIIDRVYSFKVWADGSPEPANWLLQGTDVMTEPVTGSFALIAHNWDMTFGDVSVTEIPGNDIVPGTSGNDVLVAVDTSQAHPGAGEVDVLVGNAGSDTFVFGDFNGTYYDDGNSATTGTSDYGLIWDFQKGTDHIQLAGGASDYLLTTNAAGLPSGTDIWHAGQGGAQNELVAVVNGVTGLNLNNSDFVYTNDLLV
jgi:Bacterial Ig domain